LFGFIQHSATWHIPWQNSVLAILLLFIVRLPQFETHYLDFLNYSPHKPNGHWVITRNMALGNLI